MDFDLALREEEPAAITKESSAKQKQQFGKWEKANRMSLLIMKRAMSAAIRGGIPTCEKAKDFLEVVEAKFKKSDKAETRNLMTKLTTLKYDGTDSVREHIMRMIDVSPKLKDLEVPIDDNFLVHMALNSLPPKYAQIKVSYNNQKDKQSLDDLISICAQEENRLKDEKTPVVYLVHAGHHGKKIDTSSSGKSSKNAITVKTPAENTNPPPRRYENLKVTKTGIFKCYFCKNPGHMKKDCGKYQKWLAKKGTLNIFVFVESNLVLVPPNSWWFDTGCSVHITNTLQGFSRERAANKGEYNIFVGNGIKVAVESIGSVKLKLSSGFVLELKDVLYVPSMRRSLVSASKLVKSGFAFIGDDESVRIFHKNKFDHLLGIVLLDSDLWHLQCSYFKECMNVECSVPRKRLLTNENLLCFGIGDQGTFKKRGWNV